MKVIEYIKQNGLEALTENFGIEVKERNSLILLDYDMIKSPKTDPIVAECRGLILEKETLKIICHPFDRFFNYGECNTELVLEEALKHNRKITYFDKIDGSLIKIYYYKSQWHIATRGTIIADNETTYGSTFQDLVLKALKLNSLEEFQKTAHIYLDEFNTYLFELTSIENRVVTRYEGYTLTYLATRHNQTGQYLDPKEDNFIDMFGAEYPSEETFKSIEEIQIKMKEFKNLEEGFVIYIDNIPKMKLKSDIYITTHHLRGNGIITPKMIMNLISKQEHEEYLSYFPEETSLFTPYVNAYNEVFTQLEFVWNMIVNGIEDQKEFALAVKEYKFSGLLFSKKRQANLSFKDIFSKLTEKGKQALIESML